MTTKRIQASGCLPFAVHNKEIYFLLGKESCRYRYQASKTWCDFGGGITGRNKDPFSVAVQELQEESFSVLFKSYFQAKEMVYKNTVGSVMSDIGDRQPYMMFLVKVPYDPNINKIFQRRIRVARLVKEQRATEADRLWLMKEVPEAFQRNGKLRRHWLEKEELCWFKIDELQEGVQNPFGMMLSHGHIRLRSEFFKTLKKYSVLDKIEKTLENKYESQPFITV